MLIQLAFRNLVRNRRRSVVTITAIAVGLTAVCLFGGYVTNTFRNLQESSIYGEGLGHLTLAKQGYFDEGHMRIEDFVFNAEELKAVSAALANYPSIILVAPRFSLSGLVSNGDNSTIFIADAIGQKAQRVLRGNSLDRDRSGLLPEQDDYGIIMASDLARSLNLQLGDNTVLFTSTLSGQANAYDVVVSDIVNTGNVATNDKFLTVSLSLAQNLLDSRGAEKITILLDDINNTTTILQQLNSDLSGLGFDLEIRTWEQLSVFYQQVRAMFALIFLFIFLIVLIIVVMNIINTISMTVVERTREIGTLRALGMQRGSVRQLFSLEGLLLAMLGSVGGVLIAFAIATAINLAQITYVPPGNSTPSLLTITVTPILMVSSVIIVSALATVFSILPARRAARMLITDALGHV